MFPLYDPNQYGTRTTFYDSTCDELARKMWEGASGELVQEQAEAA